MADRLVWKQVAVGAGGASPTHHRYRQHTHVQDANPLRDVTRIMRKHRNTLSTRSVARTARPAAAGLRMASATWSRADSVASIASSLSLPLSPSRSGAGFDDAPRSSGPAPEIVLNGVC